MGDSTYRSVLAIHMAALAFVDAAVHGNTAPLATDATGLSAYLLKRERAYWDALYSGGSGVITTQPMTMPHAVYTATLTRPLPYELAVAALARITAESEHKEEEEEVEQYSRILEDHARCYPPRDKNTRLERLYPDRLGEDFVALSTPGHSCEAVYESMSGPKTRHSGFSAVLVKPPQRGSALPSPS